MSANNEDPRPIVEGIEDITSAVIDSFLEPVEQPEKPAIDSPDQSVMERFLERVPADLRDKVTVQVGATKVKRPGQDANLAPDKEATLKNALDNPEKVKGSIKILGEDNKSLMQITGGKVALDTIGFSAPKLEQAVEAIAQAEAPTITGDRIPGLLTANEWQQQAQVEVPNQTVAVEAIAPTPEVPKTEQVTPSFATPQDAEKLTETIARLEARVAALEQQIAQKPVKLNNSVVGWWLNAQRDKLAATVRQNVDKVAVKGHSIADRIAATKQTVVDVADGYKLAAVTAAGDLKQSFNDGKAAIVDGANLVKEVATQGAKDLVNEGMSRHYQAMDGMAAKINDTAANVADGTKTAISDPRQAFMDKVLQPAAERMFQGAEKLGKVEPDGNGNQSVAIGPYRYSKEPTGITLRKDGQVVTAATLSKDDVASIEKMRSAFPRPDAPKLDAPKLTAKKHKISI